MGGAKALGRTDIGVLEPGFRADLAVWPGDDLADMPDPVAALVLGPHRGVRHLFVDGEPVVQDFQLLAWTSRPPGAGSPRSPAPWTSERRFEQLPAGEIPRMMRPSWQASRRRWSLWYGLTFGVLQLVVALVRGESVVPAVPGAVFGGVFFGLGDGLDRHSPSP